MGNKRKGDPTKDDHRLDHGHFIIYCWFLTNVLDRSNDKKIESKKANMDRRKGSYRS